MAQKADPPSLRRWLLRLGLVAFALGGWVSWAVAGRVITDLTRQNFEWEQLNGFLLADVKKFKERYDRIERTSRSGRGPIDYDLRQKIAELRGENGMLQKKLHEYFARHEKEMQEVLESKSRAVNLGTLSVSGTAVAFEENAPATRPAKIVSVDEQDQFVVINLGKKSGIKVGADFFAKRGDAEIAKLHVIEARDSLAACDVLYLVPGPRLRPNDEVRLAESR